MNYNINKLDMALIELMHELVSAEQSLVKLGSVHFAESSCKPKGKPKGKNKNQKNKKKGEVYVSKMTTIKKPKGKCFKCGEKGHWKQNCPKATKKPGMGDLNIVEACLVENYNNKWIIDSRATNHICYSLRWFQQIRLLEERQKSLRLGNGEFIHVRAVGFISLYFENKRTLFLSNYLFLPNFKRNLVSINCLIE